MIPKPSLRGAQRLGNPAPPALRQTIRAILLTSRHSTAASASTLRLLAHTAAGTLDPHLNYTAQYWQLYAFTYDGLVAFRKVAGPTRRRSRPRPGRPRYPTPEDGGLLYRFHLRPGIRFSDGRPLGPADVVASLRRIFRVRSPTAETFYGAIAGAPACLATPDTCSLDGVEAAGRPRR